MNRKELEDSRTEVVSSLMDVVTLDDTTEYKQKVSMIFLLEAILVELEYMNDSRDAESEVYNKSIVDFTEKVGGTD